jgi:hypothetical protein
MPFFCFKLGDSATKTRVKLQRFFEDKVTSKTQAFRWRKMFSECGTLVKTSIAPDDH